MRVLHLVHTPGPGGTETVVENLIRWQPKSQIRQAVACPEGHLADRVKNLNVPVYTVPFDLLKRSSNPLTAMNTPRVFSVLRNIIQEAVDDFSPDIVHSHSVKATIVARHALRMYLNAKLIWHLHDFAPLGRFRRLWIAWAERASDAIAAVSRDVGETVCPGSSVHVVYNALETNGCYLTKRRKTLPESDTINGRITIGYLGRLHKEKGIRVLLTAFRDLCPDVKNTHLLIAGEPPADNMTMRSELESYAKQLQIDDQVSFMGRVSDTSHFYGTIDVFVLPAPREPFGLVILEALSHGCPVIACDAGGPREILADFKGAILVKPDDPLSLSEALETMIHDSSFREYAMTHGQGFVQNTFSPRTQVETIRSLYEELTV